MTTHILVLFNLKPGVEPQTYETWARTTDLVTVRGLASIDSFAVFQSQSLLGSDSAPPYRYWEVIAVNDMAVFGADVASPTMQKVAAEFQRFADNPIFILSRALEA